MHVHATSLSDLGLIRLFHQTFLTNLRTDVPSTTTFALQTLDGGQNPQGASQAGVEAVCVLRQQLCEEADVLLQNLDIQYTIGVATGVPTTFISVGSQTRDGLSGFLDMINLLLGQSNPPPVLTTSYGFNEPALSSSAAK